MAVGNKATRYQLQSNISCIFHAVYEEFQPIMFQHTHCSEALWTFRRSDSRNPYIQWRQILNPVPAIKENQVYKSYSKIQFLIVADPQARARRIAPIT